ncbi:MAG: adenosylmethionine--8-amino-7-oxononanoate transaminase [Balneolaceae bacterium]
MHSNIWQPFTILKGAQSPVRVREGDGIWLTLEDGHRIVDCISSWWVNLHGHSHPRIVEAIRAQAEKLEHVIFANFSHEPAEKLAERLTGHLPPRLERVFFSDNGSTAVEVALKVAWQYWKNRGEPRKRFIAFEGAYHGDTVGAMSIGSRSVFTQVFDDLMFEVEYIPYPETWIGDDSAEEREQEVIRLLEKKLEENPDRYAGVVIEPLVQGAGGMRVCRESFLQKLERSCRRNGHLLIFDEVMTGFGRTGDWFASVRSRVEPDIIALSKGITGGFLPLAVTVCSEDIYEEFYTRDPLGTLWHGHSYTANPLGCAAGLASLDLMEENEVMFRGMEQIHREEMESLLQLPYIEKGRVKGTISAFSIRQEGQEDGYLNSVADRIKEKCVSYDLLLRPLGNTVYLMPPYVIREEELRMVYTKMKALLQEIVVD